VYGYIIINALVAAQAVKGDKAGTVLLGETPIDVFVK
jgi:hypothetical protein